MPALQQALWTPLGRLLAWLLRAVRGSLPVGPKALSEDLLRLQKQRALTGQSNGQDISLNEHSPVLSACSPRLHSAWSPPTRAALAAAVQSDPEAKAYRAYAAEAPAADTLVVDAAERQRRRSSALRSVGLDLSNLAKAPVVKRDNLGPEQPWSDLDQWRHMVVDERLTFAQRWRAPLVTLVLVLLLFIVLGVGLLISSPPSTMPPSLMELSSWLQYSGLRLGAWPPQAPPAPRAPPPPLAPPPPPPSPIPPPLSPLGGPLPPPPPPLPSPPPPSPIPSPPPPPSPPLPRPQRSPRPNPTPPPPPSPSPPPPQRCWPEPPPSHPARPPAIPPPSHRATSTATSTGISTPDEVSSPVPKMLLAALLALCFLGRRSALLSWALSWVLPHLRQALSWAMDLVVTEVVTEEDRSKTAGQMAAEKVETVRITRLAAERAAAERAAAERAAAGRAAAERGAAERAAASEAESRARATREAARHEVQQAVESQVAAARAAVMTPFPRYSADDVGFMHFSPSKPSPSKPQPSVAPRGSPCAPPGSARCSAQGLAPLSLRPLRQLPPMPSFPVAGTGAETSTPNEERAKLLNA